MMEVSSILRFVVFIVLAVALIALELWHPRLAHNRDKKRLGLNIGLATSATLILIVLAPLSLIHAGELAQTRNFGILNWLALGPLNPILGFLALDMMIYFQHVWFHRSPFLWSLHKLHHQDTHLDVSTGLRFHPFEIVISYGLKLAMILALGIGPWTVLVFEIWLNGVSLFSHSNLDLGEKLEAIIKKIIPTPDYHRIHHSTKSEQMNSNFSSGLSFWDLYFKTLSPSSKEQADKIIVGINQPSSE